LKIDFALFQKQIKPSTPFRIDKANSYRIQQPDEFPARWAEQKDINSVMLATSLAPTDLTRPEDGGQRGSAKAPMKVLPF
jgi:hypothetical protein